MNAQKLIEIARTLVSDDKGLLAMDESNATCDKRFAAAGIPQTLEARRAYRELLVATPALGVGICGVYTYEVAESKVTQVMDFARQHQHPLQCTLEKE